MAFTREFCAFLMVILYHCNADRPPPPTGLSYKWLDPFTVRVSWQKPSGLPEGQLQYKYRLMKESTDGKCTSRRHFTQRCLTEEADSDHWTYVVWTVGSQFCKSTNESTPVNITIRTRKPRAEVKDFKCFLSPNEMNCSWTAGHPSLKLSHRICRESEEQTAGLKDCDQLYSSATMNSCSLKVDAINNDVCMLLETAAARSTFRPALVVPSPKLSVREKGNYLNLSWTPPEIGKRSCWVYEFFYKKCNEPKGWLNSTKESVQVAYDKRCCYEFQSRVMTTKYCKKVFSNLGDIVLYGTNEPPDETLTVVAIIVPIVLSVCIVLSCYCFRMHSSIICPTVPDPSTIFKEMMMNGNKELKAATGSLYTPVPESIETCKIALPENSILQQNS